MKDIKPEHLIKVRFVRLNVPETGYVSVKKYSLK